MNIVPRIETLTAKKLTGCRLTMSLVQNKMPLLWKNFLSTRSQILNSINTDLISLVVYQPHHFTDFRPTNEFERWACVEVSNFDNVPAGMETFELPGGLYVVFDYKGSSADPTIFQFIFGTWIPASVFELDDRPHFEVLGEKYKNNDPDSEEEIWIPVREKN